MTEAVPSTVGILDVLESRHHHAMSADGQRFLLRQPRGPAGAADHRRAELDERAPEIIGPVTECGDDLLDPSTS